MKKALFLLLPLMFSLTACNGNGGSTSGSSSQSSTSQGGSEKTMTFDFVNDFDQYKEGFPYVKADTGVYDGSLGDISIKGRGCFVSSYSGAGYLMMKNKDGFAANGLAFIANSSTFGTIKQIKFSTPSSASSKATYYVAIGDTAYTDSVSTGTEYKGQGQSFTVTGSGNYFCISSNNSEVNGQLATIEITYLA